MVRIPSAVSASDKAIRILPLIDFPEESAEPAKPRHSTTSGVSVDANILHREYLLVPS